MSAYKLNLVTATNLSGGRLKKKKKQVRGIRPWQHRVTSGIHVVNSFSPCLHQTAFLPDQTWWCLIISELGLFCFHTATRCGDWVAVPNTLALLMTAVSLAQVLHYATYRRLSSPAACRRGKKQHLTGTKPFFIYIYEWNIIPARKQYAFRSLQASAEKGGKQGKQEERTALSEKDVSVKISTDWCVMRQDGSVVYYLWE